MDWKSDFWLAVWTKFKSFSLTTNASKLVIFFQFVFSNSLLFLSPRFLPNIPTQSSTLAGRTLSPSTTTTRKSSTPPSGRFLRSMYVLYVSAKLKQTWLSQTQQRTIDVFGTLPTDSAHSLCRTSFTKLLISATDINVEVSPAFPALLIVRDIERLSRWSLCRIASFPGGFPGPPTPQRMILYQSHRAQSVSRQLNK